MAATEELVKSKPGAGETLRQFRTQKNLSVQEVASQLRLDPRIVEALEKDNYERFPADTYIRGYLRNYAKLIGIDGDEIISLYESEAPEPPEIIPDVKHSSQVSSSDKPVKAFTYLVTFILVLLLLIWWWQSNYMFNKGIRLTPFLDSTTSVSQPEEQQNGKVVSPPPGIPAASPEGKSDSAPSSLQPEAGPEPKLESEPTATIATPAPDNNTTTEPATAQEENRDNQSAAPESTAETEDNNQALPGPDTLYFKLNADCWIEVRDRFDKVVFVNLARTGDEIYLNGFAPFQVKLGNAQGVILEFNNKPFDPAPYTTRGIARFTLGEQ